jgi:hypothetical protein
VVTETPYDSERGDHTMQNRYRIFRRNGSKFYLRDKKTGGAESLGTNDRAEAQRLANAKNQAANAGLKL